MQGGQQLGHYTIVRALGRGGMGEVWVAHDARLNREVALKVLPADAAADAERLERFRREAQAVAALNHPNIVTVHSVEHADGVHFITLELVVGQTLDALIPDGGLPLETFFAIAIPLVEAVAAAHERGIVHRDLKPSNVMVTAEERVKVLDFGLAKLLEPPTNEAETMMAGGQLTDEGRVLGTAAFMSPEQAEGRALDHRTDIFSLGVVLYQMATGRLPFTGDTRLSVLSAIVRDTPAPVTDVNALLPRHLGRIIRKALEKKPAKRYQLALELRNDLEELKHEIDTGEIVVSAVGISDPDVPVAPRRASGRRSRATLSVAVMLAVLAGLAWTVGWLGRQTPPPRVTSERLTTSTDSYTPQVSPDGQSVVFHRLSEHRLYRQEVGDRRSLSLDVDAHSPSFHPDGTQLAFWRGSPGEGIYVMGGFGGDPRPVTDRGFDPAWSPDGSRIVFALRPLPDDNPYSLARSPNLVIADVATGEQRELEIPDARQPSWSPNAHRIAYFGVNEQSWRDIYTVSPDGTDIVPATQDHHIDISPVWSPDGRWLYFGSTRGGPLGIWRLPIDERTGRPSGEPQAIEAGGLGESGHFSLSADGSRLVYQQTLIQSTISVADMDPESLEVQAGLRPVVSEARRLADLEVSPDGAWIAYVEVGAPRDLYVRPTSEDGEERRLTSDLASEFDPRWSPDGRRIAYRSNASGSYEIWVAKRDGTQRMRLTNHDSVTSPGVPIWSPDGSRIHYVVSGPNAEERRAFFVRADVDSDAQEPDALPPHQMAEAGEHWHQPHDWSGENGLIAMFLALFNPETRTYEHLQFAGCTPDRLLRWIDARLLRCGTLVMDVGTGERRRIVLPPEAIPITRVVLSADERQAFILRNSSQRDVWMLRLEELDPRMPSGWLIAASTLMVLSVIVGASAVSARRR